MRRIRRTRFIDWAVCAVFFILGLFFLAVGEFGRRYGTTPKQELTLVTGRATNATLSEVRGRYGQVTNFLHFTVEGQTTELGSDLPGFQKILQAVRSGTTMTIGVSTRRETLFPRKGWVPLYSLAIGSEPVVTYEDTVTKGYRGSNAPLILGCAFLLIGGWGLYTCYRNRPASLT